MTFNKSVVVVTKMLVLSIELNTLEAKQLANFVFHTTRSQIREAIEKSELVSNEEVGNAVDFVDNFLETLYEGLTEMEGE